MIAATVVVVVAGVVVVAASIKSLETHVLDEFFESGPPILL